MRKLAIAASVAVAFTLGAATKALTAESGYLGVYLEDESFNSHGAFVVDVIFDRGDLDGMAAADRAAFEEAPGR